jgi:hypothetical protein
MLAPQGGAVRMIVRSARFVVACVLASVALIACGSASPSPSPPAFRHFDGEVLSFDYPGAWRHATFAVMSSFSSVLVYLSTAPLSDPCDRTQDSVACIRQAVSGLGPDGVLVEWSRDSFPGWTFDPTQGQLMTVGGRRATLEQADPVDEACQSIGGERELVATIDDPTPDQNWTGMRACLRGPSLDGLEAQIQAMLAAVTWNEPG